MKTAKGATTFFLGATLALVLLPSFGLNTASADVAGYWSFDVLDGSGNILDASGNDNTGYRKNYLSPSVPANNPTIVAGKYGSGVHFDSSKQQYVEILDSPELRLGSDFTIAMWFKTDNTSQSQKYLWGPNEYAIIYEYIDNAVELHAHPCTGEATRPQSNMPIANTEWHHIVYTKEGDSFCGYLDGVQQFSITRDFAFQQQVTSHYLGVSDPLHASNHVSGTFDDVAVWNEGLSADQVKAMYNQITTPLDAARRIDDVTYTYGSGGSSLPASDYPDTTGSELTDITIPTSWGQVGFADPLGKNNDDGNPQPQINFDLQEPTWVGQVRIDYGVAHSVGIYAPDSVNISLYSDPGFTDLLQSTTHTGFTNTDGVHWLSIDFPSRYARYVRLDFFNDKEWTFLSEVTFFVRVPEPSTWILLLLGGFGVAARWRRILDLGFRI